MSGVNKIIALGPGHSVTGQAQKIRDSRKEYKILAFQRTYPHCKEILGIQPDYWFATDPYGFIEGMESMISKKQKVDLEILVPSFFVGDVQQYRKYCGSSPLLRETGGWEKLQNYIKQVSNYCKVTKVQTTSTKFIGTLSKNQDLQDNIFGKDPFYRFMHDEVIIGSVPFDSESVVGSRFTWGLENKLSSSVFPICYYLRATEVYVIGFDLYGPRFYNDDSRHPWNDETQMSDVVKIPLDLIKAWTEWKDIHQMNIYSASEKDETLLSKVLETKKI